MDCSSVVWTTAEGKKIAFGDIQEQHLENIVRMLARKGKFSMIHLRYATEELYYRKHPKERPIYWEITIDA